MFIMNNYVMRTGVGDAINDVAKRAKEYSNLHNTNVEFDFNGVKCVVGKLTVVDWLVRDYMNAHIMQWKEVGPDCEMQYDPDTEIELYSRKLESAKKRKADLELMREQDNKERSAVDEIVKGVTLLIWAEKEEEYKQYVETNSKDGYSRAVVDYAEYWAKLMQVEVSKGNTNIADIAKKTQESLGFLGITGFMYGCAVKTLTHFWQFGEELREWHNGNYGHKGKGVVNPAVLTIETK